MSYKNKSIKEIHQDLIYKKISVRELVDESLKVIQDKNPEIHALLGTYSKDFIDSQIKIAQDMIDNGTGVEITGIPIVIKDNICVKGELATAGSKMLEDYVSPYDAHVITELKKAGAIILGRGNMDEFAMGGSTENSAYGPTKNPLDTNRVAGGSSGGSAAAVAMEAVPVALGSDTGGSIRQPAAFCNLVGLKTTYGRVSRNGVMAMGSSLDQIGPFGKCVEDVEILYRTIATEDRHDATSLTKKEREITVPLKKRIGVPRSFVMQDGVDSIIKKNFEETLEKLKTNGYEIVDVELTSLTKSLAAYYIIMPAEVSSNMGRYDGVRYGLHKTGESINESFINSRSEGLGDEVQRRILIGTYVLSSGYYDAYYNKAIALREELKQDFKKVFETVDVIATPTTPILPWKFGEKSDPLAMYLADVFTVPANIVGVPAISIPSGTVNVEGKDLPLAFQMMGPWCAEDNLFTIAKTIENV